MDSNKSFIQSLNGLKDVKGKLNDMNRINQQIRASNNGGQIGQLLSEQMVILGEMNSQLIQQQIVEEKI